MPVAYKFGLHTLEASYPNQIGRTATGILRPAKTATGDVGLLVQGREFGQWSFSHKWIDGTQTAIAQLEALEAEVARPYLITIEGQKWVTSTNSAGRVFGAVAGIQDVEPYASGGVRSDTPVVEGYVIGHWDKFRRARQFYPCPVTSNNFGLTGTYEIPLASLDGALDFDGSTEYTGLASGVSADLDISSGVLEIKAWGRHDTTTGTDTIITKNSGANDYNFCAAVNSSGFVVFNYTSTGPTAQVYTTSTQALTTGTTNYRIFLSWTVATGSTMAIYVNGVLATGSWTSGNGDAAPLTTADVLRIGADGAGSNYWDGALWDVEVDTPAAQTSAANVLLDYRRGRGILSSTVKGLWHLNERIGTTNYDSAGLNDLTAVNTPTATYGYYSTSLTPSETVDYFLRTAYGILPIVSAPAQAAIRFETHDYELSTDKITDGYTGNERWIKTGTMFIQTRDDESTNKGRLDVSYWNKSAWSTVQSAAIYGEVKSSSGTQEAYTDGTAPSVYLMNNGDFARLVLIYPSTTTNLYNVKVEHDFWRGFPLARTKVFTGSRGLTLTDSRFTFNLTSTAMTQRTQLGATVQADSGAYGTPDVDAGDSDSNNYNYVHSADPWATTAIACGIIRAKKADSDYVANDAGSNWSTVGLEFDNVSIQENQAFPPLWWFIGRYDCLNRSVAQLAAAAMRTGNDDNLLLVSDDIDRVAA